MSERYSYERIVDPDAPAGVHFRVRDADDDRIATCYDETHAFHVAEALNYYTGLPVHWSCGHVTHGQCSICHHELATKAAVLQAELDQTRAAHKTVMQRIIAHFASLTEGFTKR